MRIAIVNDLSLAVEALRRIVTSQPDYAIAWIARDGAEAVRQCAQDTPDIILMDLIMPVMNGVEATRQIMRESPCAILVVTATVDGNIALVFEAMGQGALDAVNTPTLGAAGQITGGGELLAKIATIARLIAPAPASVTPVGIAPIELSPHGKLPPLIAIGASTGGPTAVAAILECLPPDFPAGLIVVQHVDRQFAQDLATWLAHHTPLSVKVVTPGVRPKAGTVWLAGTNDHLVMNRDGTLAYTPDPVECFYRPSVDVLFKSVAARWPTPGTAVLLTGMGRDGATGLLALRQAGWQTIAQDQATSVVFGMPKAAAEIQAALQVLPLPEIAAALIRQVSVGAKPAPGRRGPTPMSSSSLPPKLRGRPTL